MSKHTPGPWRWEFNRKHKQMRLVGGRPLYDLTIMRLMAAAPDLLEALQAIELAMSLPMVTADEVLDENSPIREGIRAAIAKATGEQS